MALMSSKAVSITTVAEAAGVSATTVSHVLSGKRPVNVETARRVRRAMAKLGFVPNHAAQSLASGVTRTLGLLMPDIANPFFAEIARGVEDAAERQGYSVIMGNTDFRVEREARYLETIRARAIDGLVYAAGAPPSTRQLTAIARTMPLAMVDEEIPGVHAVSVVSDNPRGGLLVAELLLRHRHRQVLLLTGPRQLRSSTDREQGFRSAFEASGGLITAREGDFRESSGYENVRHALDSGNLDFSAVFALNDLMALGALRALREAGLRVPENVSVVGFDDIAVADLLTPGLTTVRQPIRALGTTVAEQLIARIRGDGPASASRHTLDVVLVERGSVTTSSVQREATRVI